jgi:hypothetical protein
MTQRKPSFLLSMRVVVCLHKCHPFWINAFDKVVPFGVCVDIDIIVYARGIVAR